MAGVHFLPERRTFDDNSLSVVVVAKCHTRAQDGHPFWTNRQLPWAEEAPEMEVMHVHLEDHHVVRKRSIDQNLRIKLYYDESVYK
eukprot:snap_masked-scaffold488_size158317-processed-gene-0.1 protein:Tk09355 transcript:snap_masked-scaffold488_size158317-processed-gene-0.1-mRNA-1 annotation:"PREDICTED: uncharacterized protein LOC100678118"